MLALRREETAQAQSGESQPGEALSGEFMTRGHVPVRDLEVGELRAFCAAATLGSIAEAARAMNVSQPAMSKRLRALEHVAGAELFERSSRGVTLTQAGVQLYSAARRLLRSADSVQALIKTPPVMPVRIASSPTIAELRLPQVLSELAGGERGLTAELISANSELVRELVRDGRSDLGIASIDPYALYADGLEERIVWRDELVVVIPPGHPWEQLEEIPADDFALTPVVQRDPWSNSSRIVTATLERQGLERVPPTAAIGSTAGVIAMARATGTPALVSIMAARANPEQHLEIRRVEGLRFGLEYALVWAGPMLDLRAEVQAVAGHIMHLPFARPRSAQPAVRQPPPPAVQPQVPPAVQPQVPPAVQQAVPPALQQAVPETVQPAMHTPAP
jgi:DNA-binding transcriptional LysR family regulator